MASPAALRLRTVTSGADPVRDGTITSASLLPIQRHIDIVLDPTQILSRDDGLGNLGNQWTSPVVPVDPFTLSAGDQIITHVRFTNSRLLIGDTGNGFFQGGHETQLGVYWYEDGGAVANVRTQLTWFEPRGEFLFDSLTAFARTGSGGLGVGVQAEDFTAGSFSISGFDLITDVLSYEINSGAPVATAFEVEILAGDIHTITGITINIKPGNDSNNINPGSGGFVQVAILTTDTFDAQDVDASTVVFGPSDAPALPTFVQWRDVDHDGDADLVLRFRISETGIACGDTEALLTGMTISMDGFEGLDSIKTVGCR